MSSEVKVNVVSFYDNIKTRIVINVCNNFVAGRSYTNTKALGRCKPRPRINKVPPRLHSTLSDDDDDVVVFVVVDDDGSDSNY